MATLFGKLLGGLGIGKNAQPSFGMNSSPIGILSPAKSVGIIQQNNQVGILDPKHDTLGVIQEKTSVLDKIFNTASDVLSIGGLAKDLLSKTQDVNGGELAEVTVTASPVEQAVGYVRKASDNLAQGKPVLTMGQEFSLGKNLEIPLYIGLALLAYKLLKGGS